MSKIYFTSFEKELVLALAKPHIAIIENKETNGQTSAEKAAAFREITKRYNDTDGVEIQRTEKQVRQCYFNLKKKLKDKSTRLRQEPRKTGGGEFSQDRILTDLKIEVLDEPIITMPMSTLSDSDTGEIGKSKSQDKSTSAAASIVSLSTPSYSASIDPSELVTSIMDSNDGTLYEDLPLEMPEPASESAGASVSVRTSEAKTPKQKSLPETLVMFRKTAKKQEAPSAACSEAEHAEKMAIQRREEERKEQQAEAAKKEHELRVQLLNEEIRLTRTKNLVQEKLLEVLSNNPSSLNVLTNIFK